MYEKLFTGFKFGDFPQKSPIRQIKTSPKFPAIRYYYTISYMYVYVCVYISVHVCVHIWECTMVRERDIERTETEKGL